MLHRLGIKSTSPKLFGKCRQNDQKNSDARPSGIQINYTDGTKHNLDVPRVTSRAVQLQKKTLLVWPPKLETLKVETTRDLFMIDTKDKKTP